MSKFETFKSNNWLPLKSHVMTSLTQEQFFWKIIAIVYQFKIWAIYHFYLGVRQKGKIYPFPSQGIGSQNIQPIPAL